MMCAPFVTVSSAMKCEPPSTERIEQSSCCRCQRWARTSPRKVFGQALRHLRTNAGMSQEQLGRAAFISGDMIAKVERGDRSPSAKLVEACEGVAELSSNGMLMLLWDQLQSVAPVVPWLVRSVARA